MIPNPTKPSPGDAAARLLDDAILLAKANQTPQLEKRLTAVKTDATVTKVSPERLALIVNVPSGERETEDVLSQRARPWYFRRNLAAIVPLILSWLSLSIAVLNYQNYLIANPYAVTQPFLRLWQEGFGGADWLTFFTTGMIDVAVLALYFVFQAVAQRRETQATKAAATMATTLNDFLAADKPLAASAGGAANLPDDAPMSQVVQVAIEEAIRRSVAQNQVFIEEAQNQIRAAYQTFLDTVENYEKQRAADMREREQAVKELTAAFNAAVSSMNGLITDVDKELTKFTTELGQIVPETKKLVESAGKLNKSLSDYAERYEAIGLHLDAKIGALKTSVDGLTAEQLKLSIYLATIATDTSAAARAAAAAAGQMNLAVTRFDTVIADITGQLEPAVTTMATAVTQSATAQKSVATKLDTVADHLEEVTRQLAWTLYQAQNATKAPRRSPTTPSSLWRRIKRIFGGR